MNNEPIIIDGVDVNGCEYRLKGDKCSLFKGFIGLPCNSNEFKNCHYKQLKRKEQELKSCREEIRWLHKMDAERNVIKSCMINTIVNLEEENSKLKAENEKLKNCFTEIKEIAEKHAPICSDNTNCDYKCRICHLSDLKQIIKKINEVEECL